MRTIEEVNYILSVFNISRANFEYTAKESVESMIEFYAEESVEYTLFLIHLYYDVVATKKS